MNCTKCGSEIPNHTDHCPECGEPKAVQKKENVITGIVGALIGAALGAGSIIFLSQIGYVASISGLILAVCTLKGYELLGGQLSGKGIIICIALMLVTPYLADRIDWAIVIMNTWVEENVTFGQAFAVVPALIADGAIELSDYLTNLAMIYGFALLGAFATLRKAFKK